jgi:hypothetical protein
LADAAIAVKFDLVGPLLAHWQSRHRLALHRLNERRFCALPNWLVLSSSLPVCSISLSEPN